MLFDSMFEVIMGTYMGGGVGKAVREMDLELTG